MGEAKVKKRVHYDDETLEKMKRYYKIDDQITMNFCDS